MVDEYEWRDDHCYPSTEKTCFLVSFQHLNTHSRHITYGTTVNHNAPKILLARPTAQRPTFSAGAKVPAASCVLTRRNQVSGCFTPSRRSSSALKSQASSISAWNDMLSSFGMYPNLTRYRYGDACLLPPTASAGCALVDGYEWRNDQCYPATEKTCLLVYLTH
jgi:hypothetical protein